MTQKIPYVMTIPDFFQEFSDKKKIEIFSKERGGVFHTGAHFLFKIISYKNF
jgi:hypothetical protein